MKRILAALVIVTALSRTAVRVEATPAPAPAPVTAGTQYNPLPNADWSTDQTTDQVPANTYLPIFEQRWYETCHQQMRFGNYSNRAYGQLGYVSGNCAWGGISITYMRANGSVVTVPTGGWMCTTGSTNPTGCAQLGDGTIWLQPVETFNTYVIQVSAVLCQHTFAGHDFWHCTRTTMSIRF